MNPGGEVAVRLIWDGQRIVRAEVESRRPFGLVGQLRGKSAPQAAQLIPLLFSLCGKAQGAAAATALEFAAGCVPDADEMARREQRVLAEAIQELLWRFLLDLPRLLGEPGEPALLGDLRRRLARVAGDDAGWEGLAGHLESVVGSVVLGMSATRWHDQMTPATVARWLHGSETATARLLLGLWNSRGMWGDGGVALMPEASRERLLGELLPALEGEADFAARPHWLGEAVETGSLARTRSHPLTAGLLARDGATIVTRLLARLVELVELVRRLRQPAPHGWVEGAAPSARTGLAWAQTARGLLVHRAELDGAGNIQDYRIVAPTEWNFHPAGACARGLTGKLAASADQAHACASLLVQALDPCVAHEIEVCNA